MAQALERDGKSVWLLDCTQEADSPAFFGILKTRYGILLGCWKMATENQLDVTRCLQEAAQSFGKPGRLLRDLGAVMRGSCAEVLADVPDSVCHFHLARDSGEDLFRRPQKALSDRLQTLKLQMRLRGQRQDQVDSLRRQLARGEAVLLLQRLLDGEPQRLAEVASRESWRNWKTRQRPSKIGQLPRVFLRRQNFLSHLLEVCLPLPTSL